MSASVGAVEWRPLSVADLAGTALAPAQPLKVRVKVAPKGTKFEFRRKLTTSKGAEHWRFQQTWQGLPIWAEYVDVHRHPGQSELVQGRVAVDLPVTASSPAPVMPIKAVLAALHRSFQKSPKLGHVQWRFADEHVEQVWYILDQQAIRAYAVYFRSDADGQEPVRFNAVVDAASGKILRQWNGLTHADAQGPGGNQKTGRYEYGTGLPKLNVTQEGNRCVMKNDNVTTINLNHSDYGTDAYEFPCPENTFKEINGAFSPLNDAHFFGNATYKMFQEWVGTAPLSFPLTLRVHFLENYENAFWDGSTMTFGDGGSMFYPLVDANVVSHEVAHGFTEQHSNLIYAGQSGGINEAYSDMAGEALEQFVFGKVDWVVGANIHKEPGAALRYFEQPSRDGSSIDHASQYYNNIDVHNSSGIFNRAFYVLANTTGWTVRRAFSVFTYANRYYWKPNSTFESAACDTILSAKDTGLDWRAVNSAFIEVGVTCTELPIDTDNDGVSDLWELLYGLNPEEPKDAQLDSDGDGLSNLQEYSHHTFPNNPDSDEDGLHDGAEVNTHGTLPNNADSDQDQMPDGWEILYGLQAIVNDQNNDLDVDGFSNLDEFMFHSLPNDASSFPERVAQFVESFEQQNAVQWRSLPGILPWHVSDQFASDGKYGFRSGATGHSQISSMQLALFTTSGVLSFDAGVDSEANYDFLTVTVDGEQVLSISGAQRQPVLRILAPGRHEILVQYLKDGSVVVGEDAAWIDNVRFGPMADSDQDGIYDQWEMYHGMNPNNASDAAADWDLDGLSNGDEFRHGTQMNNADTDADGAFDGEEISNGIDPLDDDSDNDGMRDGWELHLGLNPRNADDAWLDADGDGLLNFDEWNWGTNPNAVDTDQDGLTDLFEAESGFNPTTKDTDFDQMPDNWEYTYGLIVNFTDAELDLDNDGFSNVNEYRLGTLPNDAASIPQLNDSYFTSFENEVDVNWFATMGWPSWKVEQGIGSKGRFALRSAVIDSYGLSDMHLLLYTHEGRLTFDAGVDNESGIDSFAVLLDGWNQIEISGVERHQIELDLTEGLHQITVRYLKNSGASVNQGLVWIDNVRFLSRLADADGDRLPDQWELENGLDANNSDDVLVDSDGDGLSNMDEFERGTRPRNVDSDADGLPDGVEVNEGLNPLDPADALQDMDGDGINNVDEYKNGTDMAVPDRNSNGNGGGGRKHGGGGGSTGPILLAMLILLAIARYRVHRSSYFTTPTESA